MYKPSFGGFNFEIWT